VTWCGSDKEKVSAKPQKRKPYEESSYSDSDALINDEQEEIDGDNDSDHQPEARKPEPEHPQ